MGPTASSPALSSPPGRASSSPLHPTGDGPSPTTRSAPSRLLTPALSSTVTSALLPWPKSLDSSSTPPTSFLSKRHSVVLLHTFIHWLNSNTTIFNFEN